MAVRSIGSGDIQGAVKRVIGLKKQGLKNRVAASLQKKGSIIKINTSKNLLRGVSSAKKGSKVNVFA